MLNRRASQMEMENVKCKMEDKRLALLSSILHFTFLIFHFGAGGVMPAFFIILSTASFHIPSSLTICMVIVGWFGALMSTVAVSPLTFSLLNSGVGICASRFAPSWNIWSSVLP